jgi:amine acid ABC transporter, permease protein, 3-TM region, His/Glu/Gln/Arg/opine family
MQYRGLDRPHSASYYRFYKLVYVFGLLAVAGLLAYATSRVEYTWRWYRVPQYFWSTDHEEIRSEAEGTVAVGAGADGGAVLTITPFDGGAPATVALSGSVVLRVDNGQDVYMGDIVAEDEHSGPGILLRGLWVTIKVSALAIVVGIAVGLITGLCRLSGNPALRWGAMTYIEIIRGSPLMVQIFLWYFVVGYLIDELLKQAGLSAIPPLWYGVLALAIFTGAYVAEIVRAGIQSVPRGQMEAARSLGMTHAQSMRQIVLPQAFRRILPPLAGQFISLIKDSSLLGVMAVRELTKVTREAVTSSLQALEMWFTCAILYLVITFMLSLFVQYLERKAVRR